MLLQVLEYKRLLSLMLLLLVLLVERKLLLKGLLMGKEHLLLNGRGQRRERADAEML